MKDHHIAQMVNKIEASVRRMIPDAPQSLRASISLPVSQFMHDVVDPETDKAEKDLENEIIQRDYWEEQATTLAYAVGEHLKIDVGEHSNINCPVRNAIDAL